MATESWTLAIDFGTSYSVAASRRQGQVPEVIEIDGDRRIPSVVMVTDDFRVVVGRAADEMSAALTSRVLRSAKSRLGDPAPIVLGGKPFQAASLVAEMLAKMYDEAVRYHGSSPETTRLTYPATWSGQRQQQLRRAAELAGLPTPILVLEPVAAAISYADTAGLASGSNVVVYDLGGGTLDCAALQSTDEGFDLIGRPNGDRQLGGELFDELLANAIGERLADDVWENLQLGQDVAWSQAWVSLRREARRAKELLSTQPVVDLLVALPNGIREVRVTRPELDAVIGPYIADSVEMLVQVTQDANLTKSEVDAIYLVGGGSRMPLVEVLIAEAFPGVPISRRGDPKSVVALGATHPHAVVGRRGPVVLTDQPTDPQRAFAPPTRLIPPGSDETQPLVPGPPPRRTSRRSKRRMGVVLATVVALLLGAGAAFAFTDLGDADDGIAATTDVINTTSDPATTATTAATATTATSVTESTLAPSTTLSDTTTTAVLADSVLSALQSDPNYSQFLFLADVAGLTETLRNPGNLTVFAPTNEAFTKAFAGTLYSVAAIAASPEASRALVAQHLVEGLDLTATSDGDFVTLAGTTITVKDGQVETIPIGTEVVAATNGSAWIVDVAIVPEGFFIPAVSTSPGTTVPKGSSTSGTTPIGGGSTQTTAAPPGPATTTPVVTTAPPAQTDPVVTTAPRPTSGQVPNGWENKDPSAAQAAISSAGFQVNPSYVDCVGKSNVVDSYGPLGTQPFSQPITVVICR